MRYPSALPGRRRRSLPILLWIVLWMATTDLVGAGVREWWSKTVKETQAKRRRRKNEKRHIIFSTDSSGGLVGPNAGYDECPAAFGNGTEIPNLAFDRDIDDLMAMTVALNRPQEAVVDLIVPLFGNANMPGNFFVAQQLVHVLKRHPEIPIVAGASEAAQPPFIPTWSLNPDIDETGWGGPLPLAGLPNDQKRDPSSTTIDPVALFSMSCQNRGVLAMQDALETALKKGYTMDILGIGPMTDIACLLLHMDGTKTMKAIRNLVLLIGQEAGVPIPRGIRDFNMVMDPLAAAILLSFSHKVSIVLMQVGLTFQTQPFAPRSIQFRQNIDLNVSQTLPFLFQARKSGQPNEGPFDQYTVAYSLHPEWFDCTPSLPAYVIQCDPPKAPLEEPATCADEHDDSKTCTKSSNTSCTAPLNVPFYLKGVSAELTIDISNAYTGNLVIGNPHGNLVSFRERKAARVTACRGFADDAGGYESFRSFVYELQ